LFVVAVARDGGTRRCVEIVVVVMPFCFWCKVDDEGIFAGRWAFGEWFWDGGRKGRLELGVNRGAFDVSLRCVL
jgi:hypothetical protein